MRNGNNRSNNKEMDFFWTRILSMAACSFIVIPVGFYFASVFFSMPWLFFCGMGIGLGAMILGPLTGLCLDFLEWVNKKKIKELAKSIAFYYRRLCNKIKGFFNERPITLLLLAIGIGCCLSLIVGSLLAPLIFATPLYLSLPGVALGVGALIASLCIGPCLDFLAGVGEKLIGAIEPFCSRLFHQIKNSIEINDGFIMTFFLGVIGVSCCLSMIGGSLLMPLVFATPFSLVFCGIGIGVGALIASLCAGLCLDFLITTIANVLPNVEIKPSPFLEALFKIPEILSFFLTVSAGPGGVCLIATSLILPIFSPISLPAAASLFAIGAGLIAVGPAIFILSGILHSLANYILSVGKEIINDIDNKLKNSRLFTRFFINGPKEQKEKKVVRFDFVKSSYYRIVDKTKWRTSLFIQNHVLPKPPIPRQPTGPQLFPGTYQSSSESPSITFPTLDF